MSLYSRSNEVRRRLINFLLFNQDLSTNKPLPSIRTIAFQTGFSYVTVWKAMKMLEKEGIIEARPGCGYFARNISAVAKDQAKTPKKLCFGTLCSLIYIDSWHEVIIENCSAFAKEKHWQFQLIPLDDPDRLDYACNNPEVKALIIPDNFIMEKYVKLPSICKNRIITYGVSSSHDFLSVHLDNYLSGCEIARELLKRGHRNVHFVMPVEDKVQRHFLERFHGVKDTMQENGVRIGKTLFWNRMLQKTSQLMNFLEKVASGEEEYSTLIIGNYAMAYEIYMTASAKGIRIPQDLSMVSFCQRRKRDIDLPVSGIQFDYSSICKALIMLLNMPEHLKMKIEVPFSFADRGSILNLK